MKSHLLPEKLKELGYGTNKVCIITDSIVSELYLKEISKFSFDLFQNGLGYNNLLFISTVLGDMSLTQDDILLNLLLAEEPEAHN